MERMAYGSNSYARKRYFYKMMEKLIKKEKKSKFIIIFFSFLFIVLLFTLFMFFALKFSISNNVEKKIITKSIEHNTTKEEQKEKVEKNIDRNNQKDINIFKEKEKSEVKNIQSKKDNKKYYEDNNKEIVNTKKNNIEEKKTKKTFILKKPLINNTPSLIHFSNNNGRTTSLLAFTEMFSGTGWMNKDSNIYVDELSEMISFDPDIEWEEEEWLTNIIKNKNIIEAESNKSELVFLTRNGEIIAVNKNKKSFSLKLNLAIDENIARFVYNEKKELWILLFWEHKKIHIISFNINDTGIKKQEDSYFDYENIPQSIDFSCIDNSCLVRLDNNIKSFSVTSISNINNVTLENSSLENISFGVAGNFWILAEVIKDNEKYKAKIFKINKNTFKISDLSNNIENNVLFISKYLGHVGFAYNKKKKEIIIYYDAYEGQGYRFSVNNNDLESMEEDVSRFFNIKTMRSDLVNKTFYYDNTLWLTTELAPLNKKVYGRLIRISSGMSINVGDEKLCDYNNFVAIKGFGDYLYGIGKKNKEIIVNRIVDNGYLKNQTKKWISKKINTRSVKKFISAKIARIDGARNDDAVKFYISINNGVSWKEAEFDKNIYFKNNTENNALLWKVEMKPSVNKQTTAWYDVVGLKCVIER